MFKLWAKSYDENNRIIQSQTFEFQQEFDPKYLLQYMQVICNEWKTETPLVLKSHYVNFYNFNRVKFATNDFIDKVNFNFLTVQLI